MKRSRINQAIRDASASFTAHHWALPPEPRWDVTDLGLGNFDKCGLVLVNLAEHEEYCEKLMYSLKNQRIPAHAHKVKKEDIICRNGILVVQVWEKSPAEVKKGSKFTMLVNGQPREVHSGDEITLRDGERITLEPGVYHLFYAESDGCIIGEVSTKNDDLHDNYFAEPNIGRFPEIEEDELPLLKLLSDK